MKTLQKCIFIVVLLLMPFPAQAVVTTDLNYLHLIYPNEDLETGRGFELSLKSSKHPAFVWVSYEETVLTFGGQLMAEMKLYNMGVGVKKDGWYLKANYCYPKPNFFPSYKEGLWLKINDILQPSYAPADYHDNNFAYEISDGIGIAAGTEYDFEITDSLYIYLSAEYRWLKLRSSITCEFPNGTYWEIYHNEDFSAAVLNVGIKYEW